ncbi:MAG: hypothetical protein JO057_03305, partial [Chloroflexi bacterium]|nr:hypothetical protein [Chloroflexota bacterium]
FVSPWFLVPVVLHTSDVVAVYAYISAAIFVLTLAVTYFVLHRLTRDGLASLTGAFIYVCSTYSLLKLSQNDTTYLSILVAPIMFYLVHTATPEHRWRTMVSLGAIVAYCVYSAFLQEFSYVLLFLGLYALWRALAGYAEGLLGLLVGVAAGVVIGVPRLLVQMQTLSDTSRINAGPTFDGSVITLLRFFSRDIFGRSAAESLSGSGMNVYEGDLLFSTVFASLLLLGIVVDRGRRAGTLWPSLRRRDVWFLVAYIVFVFATMHVEAVYMVVSLAYANAPLQHSRIGVSALLPIALLSALYLRRRLDKPLSPAAWSAVGMALVIVVAATTFDYAPWRDPLLGALGLPRAPFIACPTCETFHQPSQMLAVDVIRFGVLALLFVLVGTSTLWLRWLPADAVRITLALAIGFQAIWGANVWFDGPDNRSFSTPYEANNLVMAPPGEFNTPSADEVQQLKSALDNDKYRSITLCPMKVIRVDCSNPIGLFWNLRLLDGYLSGVPERLAAVAGTTGDAGSRQIRFQSADEVPWRLMSLLNVKNAIVVSPELYMNSGSRLPTDLQLVRNPSLYVYPRAYFAQTVESTTEADDIALTRSYFGTCPTCDSRLAGRKPVDEVEGPVTGVFDTTANDIQVTDGPDRVDVTFSASAQPRFLVLDDLYARGWSAAADGQELAVYPTNVVMRGVLVPAGASQVTFRYHSFLGFALWYTLALSALAAAAYLIYRRGRTG